MSSSSLTNQISKNRNLAKLTSPHGNIRVPIWVDIGVAKPIGRVKKIKNRK
jgi:hypothetical protein